MINKYNEEIKNWEINNDISNDKNYINSSKNDNYPNNNDDNEIQNW